MNCFYFRIRLPKAEAIHRFCEWAEQQPTKQIQTDSLQAFDPCSNSETDGVFVYETQGWTVFEDISQMFSFLESSEWQTFCQHNSLIVAGYNDSALYAELLCIENGIVTKEFVECDDTPEENKNEGNGIGDIESWEDVADFADNDSFLCSTSGTLLLF